MADRLSNQRWIFCIASLALWGTLGWPIFQRIAAGAPMRGAPVHDLWIFAYGLFGIAVLGTTLSRLGSRTQWALVGVQFAAVMAMTVLLPWAMMSVFLIVIAWQVAMATSAGNTFGWIAFQTLAVIAALAQTLKPDLCYIIALSFALQLCFAFMGLALNREAEAARALAESNRELHAAQAIIANSVRDAERLRISRELHDAWGHELTALGLQLEIASHLTDRGKATDHVAQARTLARALLTKVRDVVATLREDDRCDLKASLEALARGVPRPAVHVDIPPALRIGPEQAHALMRCAQEAITNSVRHANAANLWLRVSPDGEGVRLIARDDGEARSGAAAAGSGLRGMRERLEHLGGQLAVKKDPGAGFTLDAWLPLGPPRPA